MWFLPLLVVGAIAVAIAKRSSSRIAPPSRQLAARCAASVPSPIPPGIPGPISVLGEIIKVGKTPPPTVVLCAIAEAQAIGRNDLASDIVLAFIVPVVQQHQHMRSRGSRDVYRRGSCAITQSPRHAADTMPRPPGSCLVVPPPPSVLRTDTQPSAASSPPGSAPGTSPVPTSMDDEISALLHADPARFMDLVSRSGGAFPQVMHVAPIAPPSPPAAMPSTPPPPAQTAQPTGLASETVAQMQAAAGLSEAAARTRAIAPGSPIPGVADSAWRDFAARLERESPQFESSRHVGQYRQRRERLAEIGIAPAAILGSPPAQRAALDADLVDAHRHGLAGGVFAEHLGRPITVPGRDSAEMITLSGVLGVIQCAGLEGAVGWLERPTDRKRYPHTTQAFLNTNGVF